MKLTGTIHHIDWIGWSLWLFLRCGYFGLCNLLFLLWLVGFVVTLLLLLLLALLPFLFVLVFAALPSLDLVAVCAFVENASETILGSITKHILLLVFLLSRVPLGSCPLEVLFHGLLEILCSWPIAIVTCFGLRLLSLGFDLLDGVSTKLSVL